MAGAYYAITSFLTPSAKTTTIRRKPVALSSISIPSPSRLAKRKNYLRLKLLKTLTKPYTTTSPLLPHEPPTNPEIPFDPIETPHEHDLQLPSDQISSDPCPARRRRKREKCRTL
ncbi:hypothetical protein L1049_017068 [Liquidambar formosana]|uniref:Uncharacterized protein n=1 Tax=Liquidambar formosana TaxID=63359 RepID=A0AAP0X114_LIQFO